MDTDSTSNGYIEPNYSPSGNVKWMYDLLQDERQRRTKIEEELKTLQGIHTTLMSNFNIHMKICKSYDWQGNVRR